MRSLLLVLVLAFVARVQAAPLTVVAATQELAGLAEEIGGPDVRVTAVVRSGEDPHRVAPRADLVEAAARADLLLVNGLDLDARWLPAMLEQSGNPRIQPGERGYLVGAAAIVPLQVPAPGTSDAASDAQHPLGNPHYLLDPMNGLRVAALIRDRLGELRPERREVFGQRYDGFRARLGVQMVGQALVDRYGEFEKLVGLAEYGRLEQFLQNQHLGEDDKPARLAGWLGTMAPNRGTRAVGDHDRWIYFARRFGIEVVANLEPRPGVPPSAPRLVDLAKRMRTDGVRLILASSSGHPRDVRLLAERSGAAIAWLDDPGGARDYLSMIDADVRRVALALGNRTTTTTTRPAPDATSPPEPE